MGNGKKKCVLNSRLRDGINGNGDTQALWASDDASTLLGLAGFMGPKPGRQNKKGCDESDSLYDLHSIMVYYIVMKRGL